MTSGNTWIWNLKGRHSNCSTLNTGFAKQEKMMRNQQKPSFSPCPVSSVLCSLFLAVCILFFTGIGKLNILVSAWSALFEKWTLIHQLGQETLCSTQPWRFLMATWTQPKLLEWLPGDGPTGFVHSRPLGMDVCVQGSSCGVTASLPLPQTHTSICRQSSSISSSSVFCRAQLIVLMP